MKLNNFFYNTLLALKNINQYGLIIILKSIFYEIYYSFKFQDFSFFRSDEYKNNEIDYENSKSSSSYGTPNIPTPYYFLHMIKNFLKKKNYKDFNFIDLGCGSGRLVKYLDNYFFRTFLGLDINEKIILENKLRFKKENNHFFNLDLKKIKTYEDLSFFNSYLSEKKKTIVFISDAIDAPSIIKILPIFKNKFGNFLFIMINQKQLCLFTKIKCIKSIFFKDKSRNISFFEI